jgi:hypothetical protein
LGGLKGIRAVTEQTLAVMRAKNTAFRWPKGTSDNPDGQSRFYHECRKLAREAGPETMKVLIELALSLEADERVRSVCAVAVLDRRGVRPIDQPEQINGVKVVDPWAYRPEQLAQALRLMLELPTPEVGVVSPEGDARCRRWFVRRVALEHDSRVGWL